LGIESDLFDFPLVLPEETGAAVQSILHKLGFDPQKRLVVLNVGAAWETKRWHADRWAGLIGKIRSDRIYPVLLWGTDVEKELAEGISRECGVPLVPKLSIQEVMALIQKTAVLVSGDTFALQAAGALGTPVVGLFGPTTPSRNGPFREQDRVIFHEMECSHCYKRTCSRGDCLEAITPDEVAEACLEILEREKNA
jgi:ADP-heptose:LPS heptosyltransferase